MTRFVLTALRGPFISDISLSTETLFVESCTSFCEALEPGDNMGGGAWSGEAGLVQGVSLMSALYFFSP